MSRQSRRNPPVHRPGHPRLPGRPPGRVRHRRRVDGPARRRPPTLQAKLIKLGRIPLPIIDEVGYIPFEAEAANLFFQLVSARYERASLIVTSNKPFGDDVAAAAMIDRLVQHASIMGDSYRLKDRDLGRVPQPPNQRLTTNPRRRGSPVARVKIQPPLTEARHDVVWAGSRFAAETMGRAVPYPCRAWRSAWRVSCGGWVISSRRQPWGIEMGWERKHGRPPTRAPLDTVAGLHVQPGPGAEDGQPDLGEAVRYSVSRDQGAEEGLSAPVGWPLCVVGGMDVLLRQGPAVCGWGPDRDFNPAYAGARKWFRISPKRPGRCESFWISPGIHPGYVAVDCREFGMIEY